MSNISRNNHYIPQFYLKNWGHDHKVWAMQLLVPHHSIPVWKKEPIKRTGMIKNLYVRTNGLCETDDFELWLNEEFETPVQNAFLKATTGARLTPKDWAKLIDFTASMTIRTPARIMRETERNKVIVQNVLDQFATKLENMTDEEIVADIQQKRNVNVDLSMLPVSVKKVGSTESNDIVLVGVSVGKALHLYAMKYIMTTTSKVLHKHHWRILEIADGLMLPTSDDPVMCINYYADGKYNFEGGWANPGSEIIFPISPTKIIYTKVGARNPIRGKLNKEKSLLIQELIIKHASRKIFSHINDTNFGLIRQRVVDKSLYEGEEKQWIEFHSDHITFEKDYFR